MGIINNKITVVAVLRIALREESLMVEEGENSNDNKKIYCS